MEQASPETVIERSLGVKNLQPNFPIYPTKDDANDFILKQTSNLGLIPYLKEAMPASLRQSCYLLPLVTDDKPLCKILDIRLQIDCKESQCLIGKLNEVRRIDYSVNGGCKKEALANIIHIPLIPDMLWKEFNIALCKYYPKQKDEILESLTQVSSKESLLKQPTSTINLVEMYRTLRRQLNDLNNGVYVESFIRGLTSLLNSKEVTPLFPTVYSSGRVKERNCLVSDPQVDYTYKQLIITQFMDSYYTDILASYSTLEVEMLMANLFQIVYGLDCAQHTLGFIHNNLDIRSSVFYIAKEPNLCLQYKWHDKYYRVPTYGKILKINGFEHSQIMLNKVQHYANVNYNNNCISSTGNKCYDEVCGPLATKKCVEGSFNTDLMRLGATLQKVLSEKKTSLAFKKPEFKKAFDKMLKSWINCGNSSLISNESNTASRLTEYRLKCLQEDNSASTTCTWKKYGEIPSHNDCSDALPCKQQQFFDMFRVDESEINHDAQIFVLD